MGDGLKHSTIPIRQPLNVFFNNESTFDVHSEKINLISTGSIETSNMIVKYDNVAYEWNSNVYSSIFDQNEFSNIGNSVILKSIPYSKLLDKENTSIDKLVNIVDPVVTTDVEPINLIWDFTDITTLPNWKSYADSKGITYDLSYGFQGGLNNSVWQHTDGDVNNGGDYGWVQFQLPVGYDTIVMNWGKPTPEGTVKLYINNIEIDSISGTPATKIFTTNTSEYYVAGQYVKLQEDISSIDKNLVITFSNTIPSVFIDTDYKYLAFPHSGGSETQTPYSVNFPKDTECDILIVGGGGAGGTYIGGGGGAGGVLHITGCEIPTGTYNISVGKGGNSVIGQTASALINNGSSSKAFGIEVFGGGYGGAGQWATANKQNGANGGSGGAGGPTYDAGSADGGSNLQPDFTSSNITVNNYHYYGGNGASGYEFDSNGIGANGGGGAGGNAISTATAANSFNGGKGADGKQIDIDGNNYYWGGGGGGGQFAGGKGGDGGKGGGGGGNGSESTESVGIGGKLGITNGQDGDPEGDGTPTSGNGGPGTGGGGGGTGRTSGSPNAITGSGGSGIVIIRYKLTSGSIFNGKTPGILKYLPTTTNPPSNTGSWAIQEADTVTFKSDFVYTLPAQSTSTPITQVNGNNYTTDFLFDPDTKFTPKENWGKNYTYNICASVNSTDTVDNKKYCFVFVYFNNKSGTPTFNHNIISSNDENDWTISDYTHTTTNKRYVKITVQTTNTIEYLNIKI
jgi:hypothetical protein